jgi:signal transduction histidine kinase
VGWTGLLELSGVRARTRTGRARQGVDARTTSLLVIAILSFRVLFTAAPLPVLLAKGGGATVPAFTLGVASILLSAVMIGYVARGARLAAPLLVADFLLSCAAGLTGTLVPADSGSLHAALWFPFHGTVMLLTVLLGAAWGWGSVVAGVGMFAVLFAVEHLPEPAGLTLLLTHAVWLTLPLVVAVVASVLLRRIVRAVLAHGERVGRTGEQMRMTRALHDTVLQTLDAMAVQPGHDEPADDRLTELRIVAARQAVELRQLLRTSTPGSSSGMAGMLAELVREFAGMGLRLELVADDFRDHEPDTAVRCALRDAAREALRNVVKHAGVRVAVLRAARTPHGVEVTVRDRGNGFDQSRGAYGIGIEHSIVTRMREVGGEATVWSRPRRGTRIRLVAPT